MALVNDLRSLRARTLSEFNAIYDYYTETISAWQVVQQALESDWDFYICNDLTGTVIPRAAILDRAQKHIAGPLMESTFQQFLAIFEAFVVDFLRLWLYEYPQSLRARKVDVGVILNAPDRETILRDIIDLEIGQVMYDKPAEWFAFIESRVHLGCPTAEEIEQFTEAKATRDVLAHNRGVANALYLRKAAGRARFEDGERVEISEPYHREVWNLCRKLVGDMATAGEARVV